MANLYYSEQLDAETVRPSDTLTVSGEEARHAVKVARLRLGEQTLIGDGRGTLVAGEVISVERERFSIRADTVTRLPAPHQELVLVQALAKGDRDERAVEQATEFGVDKVTPWQASRSVSRWDFGSDKQARGVAKWAKIAREAAKQSVRSRIPVVTIPATLSELCALAASEGVAVAVLHPRGTVRLSDWARALSAETSSVEQIVLVVGPEGGIAESELDALEDAGADVLVLGETVLRTSSAGPAALAVLNTALGRW